MSAVGKILHFLKSFLLNVANMFIHTLVFLKFVQEF